VAIKRGENIASSHDKRRAEKVAHLVMASAATWRGGGVCRNGGGYSLKSGVNIGSQPHVGMATKPLRQMA